MKELATAPVAKPNTKGEELESVGFTQQLFFEAVDDILTYRGVLLDLVSMPEDRYKAVSEHVTRAMGDAIRLGIRAARGIAPHQGGPSLHQNAGLGRAASEADSH